MPTEDARERLTASAVRAREGAVRLAAESAGPGGPPAPGDLFVLALTAGLPVEWAVLDRRLGGSGRAGELLAVPADAHPAAGSGDVEVPPAARGGPLSLRCRFGVWLDAGLFAAGKRSGSLAPETVAEALQRLRWVEAGTLEPSPLAEEVDADPEYEDWIRDVPERARALVLAARQPGGRQPESRPPRLHLLEGYRLAAMFALLAIGLSVWVVLLRREVGRLSAPIIGVPSGEIVLGEKTRGSHTVVTVPREEVNVPLLLVMEGVIPDQRGRFEIADVKGKVVWSSRPLHLPRAGEDVWLIVPRSDLPDGEYHVRLVPSAGGPLRAESIVEITSLGDGS
jgi:hypothetical protein